MAQENMNFIEYNMNDYVAPNQFDNLKDHSTFIYQDHVNLGYIPLPQSPADGFQHQQQQQQQQQQQHHRHQHQQQQQEDVKLSPDNTSSCCNSPCSILSTPTSNIQFPTTPSPSPYQHASENINSTRDNSFYPDFLQYEGEPFMITSNNNKRKRFGEESETSFLANDDNDDVVISKEKSTTSNGKLINSELRRQIHIQSEQKRRAQIKDGFEDLRNELPSCLNKKMSKVALLHRTVQHIQHLKNTQMTIYAELERLVTENEQLRKFQENVVQKQSLEKIYSSL